MALVVTSVTPDPVPFPYSGRQKPDQAPMGEIIFASGNQDIALTGVGDNQFLNLTCNPPQNFAYVMMEASLRIRVDNTGDTNNFNTIAQTNWRDNNKMSSFNQRMDAGAVFDNAGFEELTFVHAGNLPTIMAVPNSGEQTSWIMTCFNSTANDVAYVAVGFVRMLQFDLQQAHDWRSNVPLLVRGGGN